MAIKRKRSLEFWADDICNGFNQLLEPCETRGAQAASSSGQMRETNIHLGGKMALPAAKNLRVSPGIGETKKTEQRRLCR